MKDVALAKPHFSCSNYAHTDPQGKHRKMLIAAKCKSLKGLNNQIIISTAQNAVAEILEKPKNSNLILCVIEIFVSEKKTFR